VDGGAGFLARLTTFLLETLRHRADVRRSLSQVGMTLAGVFYLGFPSGFLVGLRALPDGGGAVDFADPVRHLGHGQLCLCGGRLWGKTPLAPKLSPKKTLEGAVVGVIGGMAAGLLLLALANGLSLAGAVVVFAGPFVAILGDLVESGLKRLFNVKDSHIAGLNILPGHGGILDRTDSLLLVASFAYLIAALIL
jgi:phosphatidate cytidylyltransferase